MFNPNLPDKAGAIPDADAPAAPTPNVAPLEPSERIELELFRRALQDTSPGGEQDIAQLIQTATDCVQHAGMSKDDALRGLIQCLIVRVNESRREARHYRNEGDQWAAKWKDAVLSRGSGESASDLWESRSGGFKSISNAQYSPGSEFGYMHYVRELGDDREFIVFEVSGVWFVRYQVAAIEEWTRQCSSLAEAKAYGDTSAQKIVVPASDEPAAESGRPQNVATPAEFKVLEAVYSCTDCCNEVYDFAKLHPAQNKIAERLVRRHLLSVCDGVVTVDGDGFVGPRERTGTGYRLTLDGYEALTSHDPEGYPANERRFHPAANQTAIDRTPSVWAVERKNEANHPPFCQVVANIPHRGPGATGVVLETYNCDETFTIEDQEKHAELAARAPGLLRWVADLQSGMYVNCVYCGHRYGPAQTTAPTMADALKSHIAQCPQHPMAALLTACRAIVGDFQRSKGEVFGESVKLCEAAIAMATGGAQ